MSSPAQFNASPDRTALLLLDFQQLIVRKIPDSDALIDRVAVLRAASKDAGLLTIHVHIAFRPGHPEVSDRNAMFKGVKDYGLMLIDTAESEFDPRLTPNKNDITIAKTRVGAFQSTPLDQILRAHRIEVLLIAGINTSGCVLSTVRDGADRDYELVVITDCCADPDEALNVLLLEKVLSQQAQLVTSTSVAASLAGTVPAAGSAQEASGATPAS